jgi:myo-inositol-1(or 4)-monophosphatase
VPDPIHPAYLATAVEAVIRAGEVQMSRVGAAMRIEKKGAIDLVTETDREIERDFRALVARRFPGHEVLGEEFSVAEDSARRPEFCWVFDPIDGTTNFAHGLPIFGASLALEIDGHAVVAAVYDPNRRELFTAERGAGAWLNGIPLRVSTAETLIDALLCTGFPYTVQQKPEELVGLFAHFLGISRAVRRLGSAAIDLCYVAAGRLDGFWEMQLGPWDIAAGALIVQEAGGRVTATDGTPFAARHGNILATNGRLHEQMVHAIGEFQARFRSRNWTD